MPYARLVRSPVCAGRHTAQAHAVCALQVTLRALLIGAALGVFFAIVQVVLLRTAI